MPKAQPRLSTYRVAVHLLGFYTLTFPLLVNADLPDTCGGLPPFTPYYTLSFAPFITSDLPEACAQWNNTYGCCTRAEAEASLAEAALTARTASNETSTRAEKHCLYGYYHKDCEDLLYWHACARACDYNYPRDVATGQPVADPCYSKFSRRHGRDGFLYGDYRDACAFSKAVEVGDCPAVLVVGADSHTDFAVTTGSGSSICISRILQGGELVSSGEQVQGSGSVTPLVLTLLFILTEGFRL